MKNPLYQRDIISIADLSTDDIALILQTARELKQHPMTDSVTGKILASCFFEPSTRTRLSFETAMLRLGGNIIGFSDSDKTSKAKGESLYDSIKIIDSYADIIVLRHPLEGAARLAAETAKHPVINAGDGANQHPTQTLVDLFTIEECQGQLTKLNIAFAGDLKYGRTIHSLAHACAMFDIRLFFVAPEALAMPEHICDFLKQRGVKFSFHQSLDEVIHKVDILYMTRIQKERFDELAIRDTLKDSPMLKASMLKKAKSNLRILHPLPRINEIDIAIDDTPYAYYFEQAANGIFVRQALLTMLLNKSH